MSSTHSNLALQRALPRMAAFASFVLVVACLYWARPVFIPLAVSLLITLMLAPAVAALQRRRVPRTPSVLIVVSLTAVLLAGAVWMVGSQVVQLLAELPTYQDNVAKRISDVQKNSSGTLLANVRQFVHEIAAATAGNQAAQEVAPENNAITVRVVEQFAVSRVAGLLHGLQPVAEPVLTAGLVIVLIVYLLIFLSDLRSRVVALIGRGHLTVTTKALDDAGRRISRYLLAQFGLNAGFGITIALGLSALGVPHAALWGFAGGLLRYIPYLGAWIACSLPIGMSVLVSEGWTQPLSVVALFIVVEFTANLVIEPWLYGQSIGVSQAAWMVAIIFWTWLWGAVGLMLATPLTMCLVILGKYVPSLKFIDVLLGDEPVLTPDVSLYQRLLAHDEDEAADIVRQQAASRPPIELCDQVLVPALVHAKQDLRSGQLNGEDYQFVLSAIRTLADQQDFSQHADHKGIDPTSNREPLAILACPAQDDADGAALALFQHLIDQRKFHLTIVSPKRLVSEVLEIIDERRPAAVMIVALPSGGLAHTRHLCKRVLGRFPEQKMIIGRWGNAVPSDNNKDWSCSGAEYVGTSLQNTLDHLDELAQFLRPPSAALEKVKNHHLAMPGGTTSEKPRIDPAAPLPSPAGPVLQVRLPDPTPMP
jgi:predicted PurR-regulated permease PerM